MKIVQKLPKSQVDILLHGLKVLKLSYTLTKEKDNYLDFDIMTLEALLKYDVVIELKKSQHDKFSTTEGIDFPEYID
jgi:hypothetical protein